MNSSAVAIAPKTASHYERIGGDAGVQRLVAAFYAHMDQRPEARAIRAMHPRDLSDTQSVLVLYLREWLGGPKEYSAQRGHPRLRMRHADFPIGIPARDAWMACINAALIDLQAPDDLHAALMQAFFKTADWMRNRPEGAERTPAQPTPSSPSFFHPTKDIP